jgi:hypothetical protein
VLVVRRVAGETPALPALGVVRPRAWVLRDRAAVVVGGQGRELARETRQPFERVGQVALLIEVAEELVDVVAVVVLEGAQPLVDLHSLLCREHTV